AIAKADGPDVQAKWAWPAYDAQAKPLPTQARQAEALPRPTEVVRAQPSAKRADRPTPVSKGSGRIVPTSQLGEMTSSQTIDEQLTSVPQVDLDPEYLKKTRAEV